MGIDTGLSIRIPRPVATGPPSLEREAGIEPASLAWKAKVLPLNYSRPIPRHRLGGGGWIRTSVGVSQQIYSLPPLATRAPLRGEPVTIPPFASMRAFWWPAKRNPAPAQTARPCANRWPGGNAPSQQMTPIRGCRTAVKDGCTPAPDGGRHGRERPRLDRACPPQHSDRRPTPHCNYLNNFVSKHLPFHFRKLSASPWPSVNEVSRRPPLSRPALQLA